MTAAAVTAGKDISAALALGSGRVGAIVIYCGLSVIYMHGATKPSNRAI